jgi:hypothetical protein
MKKIKLWMILLTLIALTNNCLAGNSIWIQQDNQDSDGSIFIKQDGTGNTVGYSTSYPFKINGENITIIIKQIGDNNKSDYSSHQQFYGDDMTFDYTATGDGNKLRLGIDDTGADGHWYDIDITGDSNIVDVDTWADDVQKTNVDLDITGDSNTFWIRSRGDKHFWYVLMSGDSNDVQIYTPAASEGFNTNSNKAIGPNSTSHGQFADSSGSEGASADIYIIGDSNRLHTSTYGTGNYQLHDIIGSSNILDIHSSYASADTDPYGDTMLILGDSNYLRTYISGNSNTIRLHMAGGNNTAKIYLYTDSSVINFDQTGGGNYGYVTITGDSIYDYTLNFAQNGSDSCTYSYNRNNQSADVTATVSNGC